MQLYTLTLQVPDADKPRYVEEIDAADHTLAISMAKSSIAALEGILDWTVAQVLDGIGNVIWQTSRPRA